MIVEKDTSWDEQHCRNVNNFKNKFRNQTVITNQRITASHGFEYASDMVFQDCDFYDALTYGNFCNTIFRKCTFYRTVYCKFDYAKFTECSLGWSTLCSYDYTKFEKCTWRSISNCSVQHSIGIPKEIINSMIYLPESGEFIGWKKALNDKHGYVIVKLAITNKAKRSYCPGSGERKCRASEARVLSIETEAGGRVKTAISGYDCRFVYTVGKLIKPNKWDDDPTKVCTNGIHFFLTKKEAEEYIL